MVHTYVYVEFYYKEKSDLRKPDHSFTWGERCQSILFSDNLEMSFAFRYIMRFYVIYCP